MENSPFAEVNRTKEDRDEEPLTGGVYMEMAATTTIRDIDEKEWEAYVRSDNIEKSHGWYRTMEDSETRKMRYVFVKDSGKLVAASCSFACIRNLHSMRIPLLEVKSFLSETPEQTQLLIEGLEDIRVKENLKGIAILNLNREEFEILRNEVKGFTEFPIADNTYIDLDFRDFEDYLHSLSATSRRSIRITLNRAKRMEVRIVVTHDFSQWKHVAHRLQGYFCAQHNDFRGHFPEAFYEASEKNLRDNAELLLFFKEDIPLAFGMPMFSQTAGLLNLGGADPRYREYQGYFLIYYEGIRRAIEKKLKRIYFGPSTYEFKEKIGCRREKSFGLARMKNPVLNTTLKSYMTVRRGLEKKS